jgi:hypothetical protein
MAEIVHIDDEQRTLVDALKELTHMAENGEVTSFVGVGGGPDGSHYLEFKGGDYNEDFSALIGRLERLKHGLLTTDEE